MWCSRTSTPTPGWRGTATISPGESWEKEIRPGPTAWSITTGSPARIRFQPPRSDMALTSTWGSCHSRLCWAK